MTGPPSLCSPIRLFGQNEVEEDFSIEALVGPSAAIPFFLSRFIQFTAINASGHVNIVLFRPWRSLRQKLQVHDGRTLLASPQDSYPFLQLDLSLQPPDWWLIVHWGARAKAWGARWAAKAQATQTLMLKRWQHNRANPGPIVLQGPGHAVLCRCGLSRTWPQCDGAHRNSTLRPTAVVLPSSAWPFCGCGQAQSWPQCNNACGRLGPSALQG